jgi:hypothetical protein
MLERLQVCDSPPLAALIDKTKPTGHSNNIFATAASTLPIVLPQHHTPYQVHSSETTIHVSNPFDLVYNNHSLFMKRVSSISTKRPANFYHAIFPSLEPQNKFS